MAHFDPHRRAEVADGLDVRRRVGFGRRRQDEVVRPHERDRAGVALAGPCRVERRGELVDLAEEPADERARGLRVQRLRIGELENRVDVDPLTQTFNRRGFEQALARSLAYVKRYRVTAALVYLDLDDFKPVNDRHGHAAGDAMLKAISAALLREVRASDIVARIGGDEFVVLLWNVSEADAFSKAAALEKAVYATPVRWGASTMVVGASAGVALIGPLDTAAEVLARADTAMYARKMERRESHSESRSAAIRNP